MKSLSITYKRNVKLRIYATLIDYGIYSIIFCLYIYYFGSRNDEGNMEINGLGTFPLILFWFLYFVVTEAMNQATPGHDICKLIIVKSNGDKISFLDAFKRRVVDPIDIFFYGIPALICIYNTPKFQRLGDLFANTVVVKKSDIIESEVIFSHD